MESSFESKNRGLMCISCYTDDVDGSDEDAGPGDYNESKSSKKKEKRRQERDAQRQARLDISSCLIAVVMLKVFFQNKSQLHSSY